MPLALVSAADAAWYTGRPVGTIWRWASEGRITSHGGRYDVRELPGKTIDEFGEVHLGDPPPMPQRAQGRLVGGLERDSDLPLRGSRR